MAIAKIEKRNKTEWTKGSRINMGIAGGLALLSLLFIWLAVSRFMHRTSYERALLEHDSGRPNPAKESLESTIGWASSNHEARELLAKILVEQKQYPRAETIYKELIARGYNKASVSVGLGVIALRQADAEKDAKKFPDLCKAARDHFTAAKGLDDACLEAHIGLANVELLTQVRAGDKAKIAKVKEEFAKIMKRAKESEDAARNTTREGLMDLYCGYGRAAFSPDKYAAESDAAFNAASALAPGFVAAQAAALYLEAQQMLDRTLTAEDIKKGDTIKRLNDLVNKLTGSKAPDELLEPWLQLAIATLAAHAKAGDAAAFAVIHNQIDRTKVKGSSIAVQELSIRYNQLIGMPPAERRRIESDTVATFASVSKQLAPEDPARAVVLNNMATLEENLAATGSGDSYYERAIVTLQSALEAENKGGIPGGSYEVNRNLALLLKRRNKPEAAEQLKKAEAAAANRGEDRIRKDLEDLKAFFAGTLKD